jgi:hypothetical protein
VHLPAPLWPRPFGVAAVYQASTQLQLMAVYPNPVTDNLYFQLFVQEEAMVDLQLINISGSVVFTKSIGPLHNGLNNIVMPCDTLAKGAYFLKAISNGFSTTVKIIKN